MIGHDRFCKTYIFEFLSKFYVRNNHLDFWISRHKPNPLSSGTILSDRFDPASRVSAFRSRFHGQSLRHHEDDDAFADTLIELCRVGYPQSPPELRQELIAEQFVRGQSDPELKKYLWVVIRTQKDRKLQTLIEVCTDFSSLTAPTHTHRPAEHRLSLYISRWKLLVSKRTANQRPCLLWVSIPHGPAGELRNRPVHLHCSRCLRWLVGWGTRCAPQPDRWILPDSHRGIGRFLTRIGGFALRRVPVGTTPRSSVLAVVSSDICSLAAHDRTHPYHSNRRVGIYSLRVANRGMVILHRETPSRPGPHPHRSARASFGPHLTFIHQLATGLFINLGSSLLIIQLLQILRRAPRWWIRALWRHRMCLYPVLLMR